MSVCECLYINYFLANKSHVCNVVLMRCERVKMSLCVQVDVFFWCVISS